ncbi:DUF4832 domain-containing protein [Chitinophaga sp. 22321]|uniref:DUF4832 domain-containing protein n=1 Tax=Chitinophaga hostae TaxID=2831022 RepID=A0ABS5IZQ4_9BACT|nr:DUF4874 domain-containing protein [Chitinophaga hostae]MBS0027797.1 DUF4832 domain-containing protein [Chitinophaga hostae]
MQRFIQNTIRCILLCCLTQQLAAQQHVVFRGIRSDDPNGKAPLRNPERGFRYEAFVLANNLQSPYAKANNEANNNTTYGANPAQIDSLLTFLENRYGPEDSLTLSQLYIYLTPYVGKDITAAGLENIRATFRSFSNKGYKALLRFAYDYNPGLTSVSVADIQRHLVQLKPVMEEYAGAIHAVQAGLIGAWGEWHSTPIAAHKDSLQMVLTALFQNIPVSKQVMVRLPYRKNEAALPASWKARIGFHNDYFCADEHPRASGNDYVKGTPEYWQTCYESPALLIDGELPYSCNGDEWCLNHPFNVMNGIKRLRDHHYTSLSIVHNNLENDSSNIRYWRRYQLTERDITSARLPLSDGYFRNKQNKPVTRSAFDYIRDHLGYRLELQQLILPADADSRKGFPLTLTLINRGFSAPHNAREAFFVFIDPQNKVAQTLPAYARPDSWQPYQPGDSSYKPLLHTVMVSVPAGTTIAPGKYRVGLWLPDGDTVLKYNADYAMHCANAGNTWFIDNTRQYGVNILTEMTIR